MFQVGVSFEAVCNNTPGRPPDDLQSQGRPWVLSDYQIIILSDYQIISLSYYQIIRKYWKIAKLPREVKISYAFAYVFAASAASAAKCFHTEGPRAPVSLGPGPKPLCGSILLLKLLK